MTTFSGPSLPVKEPTTYSWKSSTLVTLSFSPGRPSLAAPSSVSVTVGWRCSFGLAAALEVVVARAAVDHVGARILVAVAVDDVVAVAAEDRVVAETAVELVVAVAAVERVVARVARQLVVARVARQLVVARAAADRASGTAVIGVLEAVVAPLPLIVTGIESGTASEE